MKFPEFEEKMKRIFGEGTPESIEELGGGVVFQYTTRIEIYFRPDAYPSRQWRAWVFGYDRTCGWGDSPAAAIADLAEELSSKYGSKRNEDNPSLPVPFQGPGPGAFPLPSGSGD